MARRERDDLIALCRQERVNAYKERVNALLRYSRENCFYLSFGTSSQNNELKPKYTCSGLHIPQLFLSARKIFMSAAMAVVPGTSSRSSPSCFDPRSTVKLVTPFALLPGWLKLATRPSSTGSEPISKTIGIVVVALFAATAAFVPVAAITLTLCWTRSAMRAGKRS